MNKKKILSFDLDNTLLDDSVLKIPESALKAIDDIRDRYHIVLATGRDLTADSSKPFLESIRPDAYVHNNGTIVHLDGECIFKHLMDKALLNRILDFALEHKLCICALVNNIQYTTSLSGLASLRKVLSGGAKVPESDHIDDLRTSDIQTMGLAANAKEAALLAEHFPELKVTPVFPGVWYDLMEKNISKVVGMELLLSKMGSTMQDVIAFGDSMNDYEMITAAGFGIAMEMPQKN